MVAWALQDAAAVEPTVAGRCHPGPGHRLPRGRDRVHAARRGIRLLLPQRVVPGPNATAAQVRLAVTPTAVVILVPSQII